MNVVRILGRSQRARPHREDTHWSGFLTASYAVSHHERSLDADELSLEQFCVRET